MSNFNNQQTFKGKMEEINRRHDNMADLGSQRLHHRVASSSKRDGNELDQKSTEKMNKLKSISNNSNKNEKQRRIGDKTRQLLMKSKAKGSTSVQIADRYYVGVRFTETNESLCVFFRSTITLGEAMESLAINYPRLAFNQPIRPQGLSLIIVSKEINNRSELLSNHVQEFEEIDVAVLPTAQVSELQKIHGRRSNSSSNSNNNNLSSPAPLSASSSSSAAAATLDRDFFKGESVIYTRDDIENKAVVVGVHHDDPPTTYYTIRMSDNGQERQTVSKRLRIDPDAPPMEAPGQTPVKAPPSSSSSSENNNASGNNGTGPSLPGCVSFRIAMGSQLGAMNNIPMKTTVAELKQMIENKTNIPSNTQKLACKGKILKDKQMLSETDLRDGSRITLISAQANNNSCNPF